VRCKIRDVFVYHRAKHIEEKDEIIKNGLAHTVVIKLLKMGNTSAKVKREVKMKKFNSQSPKLWCIQYFFRNHKNLNIPAWHVSLLLKALKSLLQTRIFMIPCTSF
jgi:hypothetical protein